MRNSASTPIAAFLSAAILTACGSSSVLSSPTTASAARSRPALGPHASHGVTEKVLYSFAGGSDGEHPLDEALIASNGTFYSSTERGGDSGCQSGDGCGTVFKMSTSGAESALIPSQVLPTASTRKGASSREAAFFTARHKTVVNTATARSSRPQP